MELSSPRFKALAVTAGFSFWFFIISSATGLFSIEALVIFLVLVITITQIFALFIHKRKFHMFPIIILLIALIGVTALAQSGLVAFIYPI